MSTNDYRKCAKCGKTYIEDKSVTYHRFPNPGKNNILKALAWANYCWPNDEWTHATLLSLYKTNKVLCGRHFAISQFYDNQRQRLSKFAVPFSTEVNKLISDNEHLFKVDDEHSKMHYKSRLPFAQIENMIVEPLTNVIVQSSFAETSKSKFMEPKIEHLGTLGKQITNIEVQPSTSGEVQKCVSKTFETVFGKPTMVLEDVTSASLPRKYSLNSIESLPSTSKQSKSILSSINVSKLSELNPRELKLYKICKTKLREILRLRKKIKNRKVNSIKQILENEHVEALFNLDLSNSFISLLQSQLRNCPKKPKGRRYTLNQKIMALTIYKKSPACYRLLRRMFALPCQSSLNKLLNKVPLEPGLNKHLFLSLKTMAEKQTDENNICLLAFDEMAIMKHLYYDTKTDKILGFQDHGNHGRSNQVASKALVFMLIGIRKKWKQPIAFYFSHTVNADRMTVILKEVLTECLSTKLNVVATVCDLSTVNLKVLKTLGATTRDPYFMHDGREIVTILDPPHLLKCTRNMVMKHDVEITTEIQANDKPVKGTVKWSHIQNFYNLDKENMNFVFAPALTERHLKPNIREKMRVKLAAQVFSHSVTAGILAKIATNELPIEAHATATFTKRMDELFDSINSDTPDLRRGKKFARNISSSTKHLELFCEMRKFISDMKYVGTKTKPPSQDGWIQTLNAIERLWRNLKLINIKSLPTRRLNQDPLENCFGCIRYNCGSNTNPTIQQFVAGIKTAILSNLRHSGQKKNCEDDTAVLCNNFSSFLADIPKEIKALDSLGEVAHTEALLADAVEAVEKVTSEGQACAYVCGFIYSKLRHNECQDCRKLFLAVGSETIHVFTNFREYSQNGLNYVNKSVVQCVEAMATLINDCLKKEGWKISLKHCILTFLDKVDFSFLNVCQFHFETNKKHLKLSTFCIVVKRFTTLKNREIDEEERKMKKKYVI